MISQAWSMPGLSLTFPKHSNRQTSTEDAHPFGCLFSFSIHTKSSPSLLPWETFADGFAFPYSPLSLYPCKCQSIWGFHSYLGLIFSSPSLLYICVINTARFPGVWMPLGSPSLHPEVALVYHRNYQGPTSKSFISKKGHLPQSGLHSPLSPPFSPALCKP